MRITEEQKKLAIYLYEKNYSIKEILGYTKIRSEQTLYRIFDEYNIPRRPKVVGSGKINITFAEDTYGIVRGKKLPSIYVNEAIRFFEASKKKKADDE